MDTMGHGNCKCVKLAKRRQQSAGLPACLIGRCCCCCCWWWWCWCCWCWCCWCCCCCFCSWLLLLLATTTTAATTTIPTPAPTPTPTPTPTPPTPLLLYSFLPSECVKMQNVSRFVQDHLGCSCLTSFTYNLTNELGALSYVRSDDIGTMHFDFTSAESLVIRIRT